LEKVSDNRISLKQVIGPVEVNLLGNDVKSLLNDYRAILKALYEEAGVMEEIRGKLGGASESIAVQTTSSGLEQKSIAEAIRNSSAKTDVDKVLVISYYLFRSRNMDTFTRKEIHNAIVEARLKEPTNLNVTLNHLIRTGMLREAGKKGTKRALTVTQTGEDKAKRLLAGTEKEEQ
jgi:hypothetical protein